MIFSTLATYTLTVNATNGTVAKAPDLATYEEGASVQLTAAPSAGYHFVNWSGDASSSENPVTVIMDSNKAVTANFAIDSIPATERDALIALYDSTNGDSWTNNSGWKAEPLYPDGFAMPGTEGTWRGVTVDSGTQAVTSISLNYHNLTGTIPPELASLTSLTTLDLANNELSGPIPAALGALTNLNYLYLSSNNLTGPIPAALGNMTNLSRLYLQENNLNGPIPQELGSLTNLQELHLASQPLGGPIPASLGSLTNLTGLYLGDSQLTGPIPPELGDLTNLVYLHFERNQLSGSIPPSLGG